jgi:hypothetical protein
MILINKVTGEHHENVAPGIIAAKVKAQPEKWGFAEQITKEEAEKELPKEELKPKRKRRSKAEIEADKLKEQNND